MTYPYTTVPLGKPVADSLRAQAISQKMFNPAPDLGRDPGPDTLLPSYCSKPMGLFRAVTAQPVVATHHSIDCRFVGTDSQSDCGLKKPCFH